MRIKQKSPALVITPPPDTSGSPSPFREARPPPAPLIRGENNLSTMGSPWSPSPIREEYSPRRGSSSLL